MPFSESATHPKGVAVESASKLKSCQNRHKNSVLGPSGFGQSRLPFLVEVNVIWSWLTVKI